MKGTVGKHGTFPMLPKKPHEPKKPSWLWNLGFSLMLMSFCSAKGSSVGTTVCLRQKLKSLSIITGTVSNAWRILLTLLFEAKQGILRTVCAETVHVTEAMLACRKAYAPQSWYCPPPLLWTGPVRVRTCATNCTSSDADSCCFSKQYWTWSGGFCLTVGKRGCYSRVLLSDLTEVDCSCHPDCSNELLWMVVCSLFGDLDVQNLDNYSDQE